LLVMVVVVKIKSVIHNKWVIDKHEFLDVDELCIAHGDNLQVRIPSFTTTTTTITTTTPTTISL